MSTVNLWIKYRPIRIGWCVREGNIDDIRRVFLLSHTMWGGRYNPVIPVDNFKLAKSLIEVFKVDVLYSISNDPTIKDFINKFSYLPWPFFGDELFVEGFHGKTATLLDVHHPILSIYERYIRNVAKPEISAAIFSYDKKDPLYNVLLATFGAYPSENETGVNYDVLYKEHLMAETIEIDVHSPIESKLIDYNITPSKITTHDLIWNRQLAWNNTGFYIGDSSNFYDILNFWNLRASAINLMFYDQKYPERIKLVRETILERLRKKKDNQKSLDNHIGIWSKNREISEDLSGIFGKGLLRYTVNNTIWNGLNVKPPFVYFEDKSVLGVMSNDYDIPDINFQLPQKPFYDYSEFSNQHFIVSISPVLDIRKPEGFTIKTPYIPELNEYYGRKYHFVWDAARVEREGLGIITEIFNDSLTLHALDTRNLITKLFELFGMKTEPSKPGLIAYRLIQQMGSIQGCRVFKITGVRKLIEKYKPYQSFTKSSATKIIGQVDPSTEKPNFSQYEDLFIEPRQHDRKLKPDNVFGYLLKQGVLRVGLELKCPNCELEFWIHLDDIKTSSICEFCGKEFDITTQLKDRDWRYRRSGIFGREDHQEGAISVVVTLQQLDTLLRTNMIYTTSMKITPNKGPIDECETDLVVLTQSHGGHVQLVIGECKSNQQISDDDVKKLKKVADIFPSERIETFILFSKTSSFTKEEIELCKTAQTPYRSRVILLSDRELEPYHAYERAEKEFAIDRSAVCLEDLVKNTHKIYFDPKPILVDRE